MSDNEIEHARLVSAFKAYKHDRVANASGSRSRAVSSNDIEVLWEKLWNSVDYSWQGLRSRAPAAGHGRESEFLASLKDCRVASAFPGAVKEAASRDNETRIISLQDYWRWVPGREWSPTHGWANGSLASDEELRALGLLLDIDGTLWHAVHRPEQKVVAGNALCEALLVRLALGAHATPTYLSGARAQGLGRFWREAAVAFDQQIETFHVSAQVAAFDCMEADDQSFASDSNFGASLFRGNATLLGGQFGAGTSFQCATFGGDAQFAKARFADRPRFDFAVFGANANFEDASLGAAAEFDFATFGGAVRFTGANLSNGARFQTTHFLSDADFWLSTFGENASFHSASFFGRASFNMSSWRGMASFERAHFFSAAEFSSCRFEEAKFFGALFDSGANFSFARVDGELNFGSTSSKGQSSFYSAVFGADVAFNAAQFFALDFSCVRFIGNFDPLPEISLVLS